MSRLNLEKQLRQCNEFLATEFYSSYLASTQADIASCEASILALVPIDEDSRARLLIEHGRLLALQDALTVFVDAKARLESALDDILEAETERPTTK